MAEENKKKIPTGVWIVWIISIFILFIAALGNLSGGHFEASIVLWILFGIDLLAFIIVIAVGGKKNTENKESSQNNGTTKETNSAKPNPDDLPENIAIRKKIWAFDAFVRDNFRKLPLDEISFSYDELYELTHTVGSGKLNVETLRPIVNKMLKHLNQTFNYASIEVCYVKPGEINKAGHIESDSHKIVVNYDGKMTSNSVLALLAHEISHAYQFYEFSKYPGSEREVEEFTDFLTFYLGFGSLVEKGYNYFYFDDDKEHREHKVRLGYLNDYALAFSKTTMKGRKTMKEMSLEEDEEKKIIKNKVKQIHDTIYNEFPVSEINNIQGDYLKEIYLPETIEYNESGNIPIQNCPLLTKIEFNNILHEINWGLFYINCPMLESFSIKNNSPIYKIIDGCIYSKDESILYRVPSSKSGLININLPLTINSLAFRYCDKVSEIDFGNNVQVLESQAIENCNSLRKIYFGDGIKEINSNNFQSCPKIEEYFVNPSNLIYSSEDGVLYSKDKTVICLCPHMYEGEFVIKPTVTKIGDMNNELESITYTKLQFTVFDECSRITSIIFHDSIDKIVDGAFTKCSSLNSIEIPNSVTWIGNDLFYGCSSLKSILIPNSIISIGTYAFGNCLSLSELTIPSSVKSLGNWVFSGCDKLSDLNFNGTKSKWNSISKLDKWLEGSSLKIIHCSDGYVAL